MIHLLNPNKAFLIDGIGAAISAILLLTLIVPFEPFFGFPSAVAGKLAALPLVFCMYSLTCHFTTTTTSPILLKIIATGNLLYCLLSITLVIYFFQKLTIFGIIYFIIEKTVVVPLALWEWRIASS
jgi:hypothetical protein